MKPEFRLVLWRDKIYLDLGFMMSLITEKSMWDKLSDEGKSLVVQEIGARLKLDLGDLPASKLTLN